MTADTTNTAATLTAIVAEAISAMVNGPDRALPVQQWATRHADFLLKSLPLARR